MIWKSPALLSPYEKPLQFNVDLKKSYQIWLTGLYLLTSSALFWLTALPVAIKMVVLIVLTLVVLWHWRRLKYLPVVLMRKDAVEWRLKFQNGEEVAANLSAKSFSAGWLVILHFISSGGKSLSVVILPYMVGKEGFRQLSAHLRMADLTTTGE